MEPNEGESRQSFMLRVAAEYIKQHYPDGMIYYDESDCDGYCVADDCLNVSDYPLGE